MFGMIGISQMVLYMIAFVLIMILGVVLRINLEVRDLKQFVLWREIEREKREKSEKRKD